MHRTTQRGAESYEELEENYFFLGPSYIMLFYTAVSFIVLNLFLTILIDSCVYIVM